MLSPSAVPSFARAVLTLLAAIFLYDVMGAIIKHLGSTYPPQQLSMLRNLFGFLPSLMLIVSSKRWHAEGRPLLFPRWKTALLRGGFITIAQFSFYLSLIHLPFATASAIAFAGPMFVTALSVPVLRHKVGAWRWLAVMVGFAGILMVVRPGAGVFSWYAFLPLCAALGYASSSVVVRLIDQDVPTPLINLHSQTGAFIGSTTLVFATTGFLPISSLNDWLWILAMGLAGGTATLLMVTAYRSTQPSSLSPFEYFGIPSTFLLGWFFFGEAPFKQLIPGVFFIVGGGLLILWRERRLGANAGLTGPVRNRQGWKIKTR